MPIYSSYICVALAFGLKSKRREERTEEGSGKKDFKFFQKPFQKPFQKYIFFGMQYVDLVLKIVADSSVILKIPTIGIKLFHVVFVFGITFYKLLFGISMWYLFWYYHLHIQALKSIYLVCICRLGIQK